MKKLTSRERLEKCFAHEEIDRPAVFVWGVSESLPVDRSYDKLRKLVLSKADLKSLIFIRHQNGWGAPYYAREKYNEDFDKLLYKLETPKGTLEKTFLFSNQGKPGYIKEHYIKSVTDAELYMSQPFKPGIFDTDRYFSEFKRIGDRGIVVFCITLNPAGAVSKLTGSDLFAFWSIDNREILLDLMKFEMDKILASIKEIISKGIRPYCRMMGEEFVVPPLHGPKDFFDFNVRFDKPIVDLVHEAGGFFEIHCHGPMKSVLEHFKQLGPDVLHPIEAPPMGDISIREAKKILGDKVCIEGNIQIGDMFGCENEQIEQMVKTVIDEGFHDSKNLIVCPTASPFEPVMTEKAYNNYETFIETVLNHMG